MPGPSCKLVETIKGKYGYIAVCTCDWDTRQANQWPKTQKAAKALHQAHRHDLEQALPKAIRDAMRNLREAGLLN